MHSEVLSSAPRLTLSSTVKEIHSTYTRFSFRLSKWWRIDFFCMIQRYNDNKNWKLKCLKSAILLFSAFVFLHGSSLLSFHSACSWFPHTRCSSCSRCGDFSFSFLLPKAVGRCIWNDSFVGCERVSHASRLLVYLVCNNTQLVLHHTLHKGVIYRLEFVNQCFEIEVYHDIAWHKLSIYLSIYLSIHLISPYHVMWWRIVVISERSLFPMYFPCRLSLSHLVKSD